MHVLFCSSEVFPFSKTGGLADMAAFLPKAIKEKGFTSDIVSPYYQNMIPKHNEMTYFGSKTIKMADMEKTVHYFSLIQDGQRFIFVQNQEYFERHHFYGYVDDAARFTLFSYAILELMTLLDTIPTILHLNDWQTAMIPYLLDEHYRHQHPNYQNLHTLLTIHNLEFQGNFDSNEARLFNHMFDETYIHFGRVNFLKAGIARATKINTVSPSFRNEVLNQDQGFTLDGMLRYREANFSGILNGIDEMVFHPETDPYLNKNYTVKTHLTGKKANKKALFKQFDFGEDKQLFTFIGRLSSQKGIPLFQQSLESFLTHADVKVFLMGSGNSYYEDYFHYLLHKFPNKVRIYIGFNEQVAHLAYAASDFFMMPSQYEPCGLGQMIAMRYGALPIVHETGGLKDTVLPYNQYTGEGTGFSFGHYDGQVFKDILFEASAIYITDQAIINQLKTQAMQKSFNLDTMANHYAALYKKMLEV
jgi:starch synthase